MQKKLQLTGLNRDDVRSSNNLKYGSNMFTTKINSVRESFIVIFQKIYKNKENLPWFNENVWKLMKNESC